MFFLPKLNGIFFQTVATFLGNLLTISYGIMFGSTASSIVLYQSKNTPLTDGPIDNNQASWITSYLCLSGMVGSMAFGYIAERCGRKTVLRLVGVPQMLGWFGIIFGYNLFHIYLSRILAGFAAGGVFVALPVFISEISEDSVRGTLGTFVSTFRNIGIVSGFIFGAFLSSELTACIGFLISFAFVMLFPFVEESPYYYLMQGNITKMEKSLRWFRAMRQLEQRDDPKIRAEVEKLLAWRNEQMENVTVFNRKEFFNRAFLKAFIIALVLTTVTQLCGVFALLNYSSILFAEAGSSLPPNIAAIILAIVQMLGAWTANFFADRLGRKMLITISSSWTGFLLVIFGMYLYLKKFDSAIFRENYTEWLPIVLLSLAIFISNTGLYPMAFVVITEIFHPKLKGRLTALFWTWIWFVAFLTVKYYFTVEENLGMYGCIWIFAVFCIFEFLFVLMFLPETNATSFETIVKLLEGKEDVLVESIG